MSRQLWTDISFMGADRVACRKRANLKTRTLPGGWARWVMFWGFAFISCTFVNSPAYGRSLTGLTGQTFDYPVNIVPFPNGVDIGIRSVAGYVLWGDGGQSSITGPDQTLSYVYSRPGTYSIYENANWEGGYTLVIWGTYTHTDTVIITAYEPNSTSEPNSTAVCSAAVDGDLNGDCKVSFNDLAILTSNWLDCNLAPYSSQYASNLGTWATLPFIPYVIDGNNIIGGDNLNESYNEGSYYLYNLTTGNPTTINLPGQATGISGNNIVGFYGGGYNYGFIYDITNQSWTTLECPDATGFGGTYVNGICGNNIVGYYYNSGLHMVAFIYDGSSWGCFSYPATWDTVALGISGDNILGEYSGDDWTPFILNTTTQSWTTLIYPGATYTCATGISGNYVVGYYGVGRSDTYGFIYNIANQSWTTLTSPGAPGVNPTGISGNLVVGYYGYPDSTHGFVYNIAACSSSVAGDLNGDCKVDFEDFAIMASNWMDCNLEPQEACGQ
jgi:hypothetical protein